MIEGSVGNCQDFGHIHAYKLSKSHSNKKNIGSNYEKSSRDNHVHDYDCHEGKSVTSYSMSPTLIFNLMTASHELVYDIIFNLDNLFNSPDLEPLRRPPRLS